LTDSIDGNAARHQNAAAMKQYKKSLERNKWSPNRPKPWEVPLPQEDPPPIPEEPKPTTEEISKILDRLTYAELTFLSADIAERLGIVETGLGYWQSLHCQTCGKTIAWKQFRGRKPQYCLECRIERRRQVVKEWRINHAQRYQTYQKSYYFFRRKPRVWKLRRNFEDEGEGPLGEIYARVRDPPPRE